MSGPSREAIEAVLQERHGKVSAAYAGELLRGRIAKELGAAYPIIRQDVAREIIEWTREQFWFPATPAGVASAIEREFGGTE